MTGPEPPSESLSVSLHGVSKRFGTGPQVLDDFSLDIKSGEFVVVLGASGCGKTTLLKIIAGLEPASHGEVLLGGRDVGLIPPMQRRVAMVFQSFALYPHMTVEQNIGFPLMIAAQDVRTLTPAVRRTASKLGIDGMLDRRPRQLSGGQQQRVALGRALIRRPGLFLLDEPLSNVDQRAREDLRTDIKRQISDSGATAVYVTHDHADALALADRIAIMRDGRLDDLGDPRHLYLRPATLHSAAFLNVDAAFLRCRVEYVPGSHVEVWISGRNRLRFGLDGPFARELALYHGDQVVVGFRPDAIALGAPEPSPGDHRSVVDGVVTATTPLGLESVLRIDVGGTAVHVPRSSSAAPDRTSAWRSRHRGGRDAGRVWSLRHRSQQVEAPTESPLSRLFTIRTRSEDSLQEGQRVGVQVWHDRLTFFDAGGHGIGPGWR